MYFPLFAKQSFCHQKTIAPTPSGIKWSGLQYTERNDYSGYCTFRFKTLLFNKVLSLLEIVVNIFFLDW